MKIIVFENKNAKDNIVGYLETNFIRGHLITSFSYDELYLKSKRLRYNIDYEIQNCIGVQWCKNKNGLFKIFEDQCPDRWGRKLIDKKERIDAENEKRNIKNFNEIDYLLSINDECRMGSFRYKVEGKDNFESCDDMFKVPPITSLRTLENASIAFEKNDDSTKWLKQLVEQGSSLGGARPKANIKDENNELYIAKFSSIKDSIDVCAFEKLANDLAFECGINVPKTMIRNVSDNRSIFLSKRFDRNNNSRIFYMSFMTALHKEDGEEASYLDMATFLRENSIQPNEDLKELYKRLIFNVLISNTDDHLRNHGLIENENGLVLSPAFDLVPNIDNKKSLSLNIDENNPDLSLDIVLSTSEYYGIKTSTAKYMINEMQEKIKMNLEEYANKLHIKKSELKDIKDCFYLCYK